MFERRELVRVLDIPAKYLQRNIRGVLLAQLGSQVEGKCGAEGYVAPKSSVILDHSLGKVGMLHTGVRYKVRFHADVCYPHKGQMLQVPITFKSKIGYHAELTPLRILLPRDLHIGNADFDSIEEKEEVVIEVLGSEFKQNDEAIFVLGRFVKKVGGKAEEPEQKEEAPEEKITETAPEPSGEVKSVVVKSAAPGGEEKPRRRKRLNPAGTVQLNVGSEPPAEGEA